MTISNLTGEARRYIENARTIWLIRQKMKEDFIKTRKYIRMAGNTTYNSTLVALDAIRPQPVKGRKG